MKKKLNVDHVFPISLNSWIGTGREGSCRLSINKYMNFCRRCITHLTIPVTAWGENPRSSSTWPPRDVEMEKKLAFSRAHYALSTRLTRFDSYTTGPTGAGGPSSLLFFPPFCPRYRVLPSTISIGKSVRANRDNVVQRRVIVRSRTRNWNARNRYAWNRGNVVSFKYIGRDIERLENVFRVCIPSVEQY